MVFCILCLQSKYINDLNMLFIYGFAWYRIGVVYDDRMLAHKCIWVGTYPEKPDRLRASVDRCKHYGLLERCVAVPVSSFFDLVRAVIGGRAW